MSVVQKRETATVPPFGAGQRLDRATFHALYETMPPDATAELIGGAVHMPPPAGPEHGDNNAPVAFWLTIYEAATPGVRVSINTSTALDDLGEPQPDVSLRILQEFGGQSRFDRRYIDGAPKHRPAAEGRLVGRFQRHADVPVPAQEQRHFRQGVSNGQVLEVDLRGGPSRVGGEGQRLRRRQIVRLVVEVLPFAAGTQPAKFATRPAGTFAALTSSTSTRRDLHASRSARGKSATANCPPALPLTPLPGGMKNCRQPGLFMVRRGTCALCCSRIRKNSGVTRVHGL